MRILMSFYLQREDVDQIVSKLQEKCPRVQQLIFCPLFLRIFCILVNLSSLDEIWKIVNSTANLFDELFKRLQDCAHNAGEIEDINVMSKIMKLAFKKTMDGSVVIDQNDLSIFRIDPNEIQNLACGVHGVHGVHGSNSPLVGPNIFYFAHQSIQEYLTSRHAWLNLSYNDFCNFLLRIFPEHDELGFPIGADDFSGIRTFTISLLNVLVFDDDKMKRKKIKFIERGAEQIIDCHRSALSSRYREVVRNDYNEIADQNIIADLKSVLKIHSLNIWTEYTQFTTDVVFIRNFVSRLEQLTFLSYKNTNNLERILRTLSTSNIKVGLLRMPGAQNYDENNISTLINSINEIKCKKIHLELGGNDETKLRFCIIFQDKISIFQTNNIASSDKVKFRIIDENYSIILLAEVTRNQPPMITNPYVSLNRRYLPIKSMFRSQSTNKICVYKSINKSTSITTSSAKK